jgi:hypothetical protein
MPIGVKSSMPLERHGHIQRRIDDVRIHYAEQQCVTVGLRFDYEIGADHPDGAGPVVDDERLAERGVQLVRQRAREYVGAAACRPWHDDTYRLVRIGGVRLRRGCHRDGCDCAYQQAHRRRVFKRRVAAGRHGTT